MVWVSSENGWEVEEMTLLCARPCLLMEVTEKVVPNPLELVLPLHTVPVQCLPSFILLKMGEDTKAQDRWN